MKPLNFIFCPTNVLEFAGDVVLLVHVERVLAVASSHAEDPRNEGLLQHPSPRDTRQVRHAQEEEVHRGIQRK